MEKIYTPQAPAAIGPYSQAVVSNGMVYTSGQIAIDPSTGELQGSDIQTQTKQVMENLGHVLVQDFAAFNAVYGEYIQDKPARSCVAVKELPKGALVEVEVIAMQK